MAKAGATRPGQLSSSATTPDNSPRSSSATTPRHMGTPPASSSVSAAAWRPPGAAPPSASVSASGWPWRRRGPTSRRGRGDWHDTLVAQARDKTRDTLALWWVAGEILPATCVAGPTPGADTSSSAFAPTIHTPILERACGSGSSGGRGSRAPTAPSLTTPSSAALFFGTTPPPAPPCTAPPCTASWFGTAPAPPSSAEQPR